jgi:hypothetical protein
MQDIERAALAVDWHAVGADGEGAVKALLHLRAVRTEKDGDRVYAEVLDAIGHNHSGWLHDAAGPAAAILAAIASEGDVWARRTALEVLIDCVGWVRPDQRYLDADGNIRSVDDALREVTASLAPLLRETANDNNAPRSLRKSAADLLRASAQ